MAEKTCIFTGHRVIAREHMDKVREGLARSVAAAYEAGCTTFLTGGAMGFDRMAGDAVLRFRLHHPDVHLVILVPCRDQDAKWHERERARYRDQLAAADTVEFLSERYYDGCMQARNQALVARGDRCIAYVTKIRSGAAQTVRLAEAKAIPVVNLADEL